MNDNAESREVVSGSYHSSSLFFLPRCLKVHVNRMQESFHLRRHVLD